MKQPKCKFCDRKDASDFYAKRKNICKICLSKQNWASRKIQQGKLSTDDSYDELVKGLGREACGVCSRTPSELGKMRLQVDIDPVSRIVKGLLCSRCWQMIRETSGSQEAIEYLRSTRGKNQNEDKQE